jgi:hypothetical protein
LAAKELPRVREATVGPAGVDTALVGEVLDVAQRQGIADVEHDHPPDHLGRAANQRNGFAAVWVFSGEACRAG